jgi:hypothetical protein
MRRCTRKIGNVCRSLGTFPGRPALLHYTRLISPAVHSHVATTLAGLALLLFTAALPAAEPRLEKTDLFEAGKGGHKLYRIPGLVVTARGTVLAYCEARKHTGFDAVPPGMALGRQG